MLKLLTIVILAALTIQAQFPCPSIASVPVKAGSRQNESNLYQGQQPKTAPPDLYLTAKGCQGYIEKPIDPDRFVEQVKGFLQ